ncbi:MAG: plastocyanin/azurin family copper-binding protein [Egibacteraceae bacterium]
MHTRQPRWAALAAVAALTLSACGGDTGRMDHQGGHPSADTTASGVSQERHHNEQAPAPIEGAAEATVTARAFRFEPAELAVQAGQPINIALTATDMLHDFTVDGQSFHLAADAGQTAAGSLTIEQPGIYTVYCSVAGHREAGMEATLVVQ